MQPVGPDDAQLMERFAAGDDDAFREIVERHNGPLFRFFMRRCFDRALAEDCVQEVFLRLVRHRGRWRPDAKFTTYLYRIAENYWIDKYRSRKAKPPMGSLSTSFDEDGPSLGDVVPAETPGPEGQARNHELAERIERAVAQLSEAQRSVFVLAETSGMKYAEIGRVLDIPVGTVKSRMHAAVSRLRELLEEDGRDLSR